MGKGERVLSGKRKRVDVGINVITSSHATTLFFYFSYKNPGKPDGVNYIRTDEEVWNEGTEQSSRRKPRSQGVPSRENDIPPWIPSGSYRKKGLPMILQTLSSLALRNDMYMPMAFTVPSS